MALQLIHPLLAGQLPKDKWAVYWYSQWQSQMLVCGVNLSPPPEDQNIPRDYKIVRNVPRMSLHVFCFLNSAPKRNAASPTRVLRCLDA